MTTYVDNMKAKFGRLVMCHMVAETDDELHAMAARIGVARRWHQKAGTHHSHYDICMAKRELAVGSGAIEVTQRELGAMLLLRRSTRMLCGPEEAVAWARARINRKGGQL